MYGVFIRYFVIPSPSPFSKSNTLWKDIFNGFTLIYSSTSTKMCGLIFPVYPLAGPADGAGLSCGEVSLSGPVTSGGAHSLWSVLVFVLTCLTFFHWMVSAVLI